jgi:L-malate glycosyltransferase
VTVDVLSKRPIAASPIETVPLRLGIVALGGLGGSGCVAWDIARGLAGRGHRIVRLTSPAPHWSADPRGVVTISSDNIPSTPRTAQADWVAAAAEDIRASVIEHDLEALSVHYGVGLVEAAVVACKGLPTPVRLYATLHGTDIETARHDREQRDRLALSLERCHGVTAVSNWLADEALRVLRLRARPTVINNAVDTDLFRPPERAVGLPFTLLHASNFRAVKRPLDCVEVLATLRERALDVRLVMTGDGPLLPAAQRHAETLGVRSSVEFHPPVDRPTLAQQLRRAHICLVTSETESFGLVALEAMASGVPFVGTRCGGLQELVTVIPGDDDLSSTLLAEPGDVGGLADRVQALADDPIRYQTIRRRCLEGAGGYDRASQLVAYAELFAMASGARP